MDLDGSFIEGYTPISQYIDRGHFNVTNYQYGLWMDFRWDCVANNATTLRASTTIVNTLFTGHHQQALYNFLFIATFDNFIFENNTFDGCTYLDMETRPFLDIHP